MGVVAAARGVVAAHAADMPAKQVDSPFSWWVAVTAVAMGGLSFGAVTSVPILLKPLSQDWQAGASTISLVHTSAMFGAAIGSLALGRILDRFGFFAIGVLAATATALGLLLAASAQNLLVLHLLYGVLIGGIGQGAFFSPLTAAVSQWFERHRGIAIAFVACGQSVGGLVVPPVMRWGVDAVGWRGTLAIYGLVAGIALVACSFAFRRTPPLHLGAPKPSARAALAHPPSRGGFLMLGLCMALSNHASFIVIAHLTAFGEERGFAPAAAAAGVSAMLGVSLVSRLSVGQLSAKWGSYNILLAMSVLLAIGTGVLALAQGPLAIGIGAAAMGLAFGGYLPGYAILVRELFPAEQAGRRISEIYFFAFIAAGIGSWTGGWTRDVTGGYAVPFWIAAASAIAGAVVLLPCRRRLHGRPF